jgi:hypothetical protein
MEVAMSSESLAAALEGARHVSYSPHGLVLAWFAGHGLHIYDLDGEEVDYRSVGDFGDDEAECDEVVEACRDYMCEE